MCSEPLVSVLTPVFNGEQFLAECIESVLAQTYQNWEYTVVNNCSTDRTEEIVHGYARKDPRIRIHNNRDHVGIMENHNIALRQISPESRYCKFVHADDWLFPECITRMVQVAEAYPTIGIVSAYALRGTRVVWDGLPYPSTFVAGHEVCRRILLGEFYTFGTPTALLLRSCLTRKRAAFYNTQPFHTQYSDQEACYEALKDWDFGFVHQVLTFSRVHEESFTSDIARTGLSSDFPSELNIVAEYGSIYLSSEEYQRRLRKAVNDYYRFLGQSVFYLRGKKFWDFHKRALGHRGYSLSLLKLAGASLVEVLRVLFIPVQKAAKVVGMTSKSAFR